MLDKKTMEGDNTKGMLAAVTLVYAGLSIYLYNTYGVKIMNDSPRYLTYAENLSGGIYFDPLNFWYISYVFFVAFVKLFAESNTYIILAQYILGYVSVLALFGATKRLTENVSIAFLAAMIFTLFPDNLMWNSYVLTEGFYSSMICVALYFLVTAWKNPTKFNYSILVLILLIVFFSKPTSPALFIALAFPVIWRWLRNPPLRGIKLTSLLVAGVLFLFLANKMISSHRVMLIYENGDIIFAMHEFPTHPHHDWMTIDIPDDLYKPPVDKPLLQQMASFVISNPGYFMKLFFGKVVMYISHIRTYWSWPHNLLMIAFLWPCYFFCFRVMKRKLLSESMIFSAIVYCSMHTIVVGMTWADWDGRFFVPMLPVIVLIGSLGIADFFKMNANPSST
ncbi:MAG: glycosyltransferase family 39 protein [Ekhidna sp.]